MNLIAYIGSSLAMWSTELHDQLQLNTHPIRHLVGSMRSLQRAKRDIQVIIRALKTGAKPNWVARNFEEGRLPLLLQGHSLLHGRNLAVNTAIKKPIAIRVSISSIGLRHLACLRRYGVVRQFGEKLFYRAIDAYCTTIYILKMQRRRRIWPAKAFLLLYDRRI
jgi:hypothetical protein